MNQKPTSMPICSLSMSARSCVRQLVNDESQSVSAEAPRGAAHQSTAIHALMSNRLTRCGCVGTPGLRSERGASGRSCAPSRVRVRCYAFFALYTGKELRELMRYATEDF